jgi:hypothetical protein
LHCLDPGTNLALMWRAVITISNVVVLLALAGWAYYTWVDAQRLQRSLDETISQSQLFRRLGVATQGCAERGGVASRGPFGETQCRVPFADAGRACTDMTECLGGCVAVPGSDAAKHPGARLTGVCKAHNIEYGCTTYIRRGKAVLSECVD